MATVTLTKWGNSIGIRVPAAIIQEAHLRPGEKLEITAGKGGELILKPIPNLQAGWLEAFNAIADKQEDEELIDIPNSFDEDEWTW